MTPWWNEQTAGWIGAIAGGSVGLLGAAIGTLTGIFAPRGKLKSLVFGLLLLAIAAGVILLAAGIVALCGHQPYAVWYPLMLTGLILVPIMGVLTPLICRTYRQAEARRLAAAELRRS